jgi:hypothetical protein
MMLKCGSCRSKCSGDGRVAVARHRDAAGMVMTGIEREPASTQEDLKPSAEIHRGGSQLPARPVHTSIVVGGVVPFNRCDLQAPSVEFSFHTFRELLDARIRAMLFAGSRNL